MANVAWLFCKADEPARFNDLAMSRRLATYTASCGMEKTGLAYSGPLARFDAPDGTTIAVDETFWVSRDLAPGDEILVARMGAMALRGGLPANRSFGPSKIPEIMRHRVGGINVYAEDPARAEQIRAFILASQPEVADRLVLDYAGEADISCAKMDCTLGAMRPFTGPKY